MMAEQRQLSKNHPAMMAWRKYQATDDYHNTTRWAVVPEHTEGSLWAAFLAGRDSATPPASAQEEMSNNVINSEHQRLSDHRAVISELREALREILPWAGIHDEGCDLDPEYGNGHKCNCGLQRDRDTAHKALARASDVLGEEG